MSTLIQCELCDIFVDFDEYLNHVRECSENNSLLTSSISSFINSISSISSYNSSLTDSDNNNTITGDNEEYNEEEDNEDVEEEDGGYNNIQLNSTNFPLFSVLNNGDNIITTIINLQNLNLRNIYDDNNYSMYSNFEDVKVPVKNIDEVAPIENNPEVFKNSICTICQEVVKEPVRKTLCNHMFCSNCIEPWLKEMNKTCPNCLCDLEELKAKK
jgi:hypothetical protein